MALSEAQRAQLRDLGFARAVGAVCEAETFAMRERIEAELERRYGHRGDRPEAGARVRPAGFRALERSGAFAAFASPSVRCALDALFGRSWCEPRHWGQVFVTLPSDGRWELPARMWHLDAPVQRTPSPWCRLLVFLFLDRVAPSGGGPCLLAGSHRLVERLADALEPAEKMPSSEARKRLARRHEHLELLWGRASDADREARLLREETVVDGVPLRVVELTGEPGEAAFVDPWVFHAPAPNGGERPRLMLKQTIRSERGDTATQRSSHAGAAA